MSSELRLQCRDLSIGYQRSSTSDAGPSVLASGLNLALEPGELVAILGPNGVGKTTLLKTLAGLQPPIDGRILVDGRDLDLLTGMQRARKLAVLWPGRPVVSNMTARELVALGRQPHTGFLGRLAAKDHLRVEQALEFVGATELADRAVSKLSDGEFQRVAVARLVAQGAELLLLDEPTAFLDLPHRVRLLTQLAGLARSSRRSVLFSTHDLELALRTADQLWLITPGGGAVRSGAPEDLILDGSVNRLLEDSGVSFDAERGLVQIEPTFRGEIEVRGQGSALQCTRRALERIGLRIGTTGGLGRVDIERHAEGLLLELIRDEQRKQFDSIGSLVRELAKNS